MSRIIIGFATIFATRAIFADAAVPQEDADWSSEPMAYANATSIVQQVPGHDYRKEFPGVPIKGWTMSYAVANRRLNASVSWTEAALSFLSPDSLNEFDTNESWSTCGANIYLEVKSDDQEVDPLCKGVVSDACQRALVKAVEASELCFADKVIPKECDKELSNARRNDIDEHGTYGGIFFDNEPDRDTGGFELYDALLRRIVVSIIGYRRNDHQFSPDEVKESPRIQGVLSCLRASKVKEGSRVLESGRVGGVEDEGDDEEKGPENNEEDSDKNGGQDQGGKGQEDEEKKDKPGVGAKSTMHPALTGISILIVALFLI